MGRALAIDLGTANTLVYVRGRGIRLRQPTVIALNESSGEILALGDEAYDMIGRTPAHIVAVRPLLGGAISDFETTARLIRLLLQRVGRGLVGGGLGGRPRVVVCVPSAITQVERKAVQEAAMHAGAKVAYLMEEPMAAAIGAGLPVQEPTGSLIVDVGGGTTEVACISLGGIVASKALRTAGFDLDAAITQHVRRDYAIAIGERTAEKVKMAIGSAVPQPGVEDKLEVRGRELATGLPKTVLLTAGEIRQALEEPVSQIVQAVLDTLSAAPPELANDVLDKGVFLTGGSSLLRGLADRIAQEAEVAVHVVDTPLECVALGAGRVVDAFDDLGPMFVESPRYV
ncbi:MAG TPA: rod shape-determining protein [Actinomycetes bacterium]|nr:rod shape-determining protein [Actinomycetes bacterium]